MCIKNLFSNHNHQETIDEKIEKILKQKPKKMSHGDKARHDIVVFLKNQEDTKIIDIKCRTGYGPTTSSFSSLVFRLVDFKYYGENGLIEIDRSTGWLEKITLGSFVLDGMPSHRNIEKSEILKDFFEQFNNQ